MYSINRETKIPGPNGPVKRETIYYDGLPGVLLLLVSPIGFQLCFVLVAFDYIVGMLVPNT